MVCKKCNSVLQEDSLFCPVCGTKVEEEPARSSSTAFKIAGDLSDSAGVPQKVQKGQTPAAVAGVPDEDRPVSKKLLNEDYTEISKKLDDRPDYTINYFCLALMVICLIAWFTVPFMAVNYFTFGDQPTALELLQGDVLYIGELSESAAYRSAVISIVGLALCAICILRRSRVVSRLVAAVTLIPLAKNIIDVIRWTDDFEEFMDFFGAAYWCIVAGLLLSALFGGRMRKSS